MSVSGLVVEDISEDRVLIDSVDVKIHRYRIGAIVGESGAGKTLVSRSLVGLLPPNLRIKSGHFRFRDQIVVSRDLGRLRGRDIFYIPQGAGAVLNPSLKIGVQLSESSRTSHDEIEKILARLGLDDSRRILRAYPFQLSEGECQRCLLAMGIAASPELLVLDEPVASLDEEKQIELMDLLKAVPGQFGMTVFIITHNVSLIHGIVQDVHVMLNGRVVDCGTLAQIVEQPNHPYTRNLVKFI
jgi:peptide/nickel transport system ATP-binding protein